MGSCLPAKLRLLIHSPSTAEISLVFHSLFFFLSCPLFFYLFKVAQCLYNKEQGFEKIYVWNYFFAFRFRSWYSLLENLLYCFLEMASASWEFVSGNKIKTTRMLWLTTNKNATSFANDLVLTHFDLQDRYTELRGFTI